jgi:4-hydroxy-3-methylbut-2-enyl diphosphate reductase
MISIEIDKNSGFCFGVVNAIRRAESELAKGKTLNSLCDLVHNGLEMERLKKLGLQTIHHNDLPRLQNKTVLLRAHGEPPLTYRLAEQNSITIIDATCPVVLKLQRRIFECYNEIKNTDAQLVIYGKQGHAEVNGLVGQTEGKAIVVEKSDDLDQLDFKREIALFSQTTMPLNGFLDIVEIIRSRIAPDVRFRHFDTVCRQVTNRLPKIKEFASRHDIIFFVAGRNSSNGKVLFEECRKSNPNIVFISDASEITSPLPSGVRTVGVCGATSTPKWLMEEVADRIKANSSL